MFLLPIMAVLVLAAFSVQERPRALRTFQPTQAYSGEQALAQVNRLAAVYPSRPAGEAADNDLARELADRFRAGSLEVSTQTDRIDTGTGDREAIRVTGRRAATGTGAIAVVAARDSVRPGARAELTATATLLELGALLGQRRIEHPVLLISVSGTSPNAVKAAEWARRNDVSVVTFTGKSPENPLKAQGDINFHIPSGAYNVVEGVHNIWLTTVVDMLVGEAEYSVV